jgi:hypothetical protein
MVEANALGCMQSYWSAAADPGWLKLDAALTIEYYSFLAARRCATRNESCKRWADGRLVGWLLVQAFVSEWDEPKVCFHDVVDCKHRARATKEQHAPVSARTVSAF